MSSYEKHLDEPNLNNQSTKQNLHQNVFCSFKACGRRFKRSTDRKRHENSKHKGSGYFCGDCAIQGKRSTPKRKDHLREHLQTQHSCEKIVWNDIMLCDHSSCRGANQMLAFSSQTKLDIHMRQKHHDVGLSTGPEKHHLLVASGKWSSSDLSLSHG